MRQAEKGRKQIQARIPFILDPGMKIPKEIAKKLKNLFPALFPGKNWMRQAEKVKTKFQSRIPFIVDPGKKIQKKIAKKFKKFQKTSFRLYFQPKRDKIGIEREKKFQSRILLILDPVKKIPKKITKKFKIIKNLFPALFLDKTG